MSWLLSRLMPHVYCEKIALGVNRHSNGTPAASGRKGVICYNGRMKSDEVKEILYRVLTWPSERQADVVRMIELVEEHDNSDLRPADE